jgi:hypothetical protein
MDPDMTTNALFFGWNRSIPGREKLSAAHFQEFVHYLGGLQQSRAIDSYDTVFLELHGGDLNGFFLLRAAPAKLDALLASQEWNTHMLRAGMHLEGSGAVRAVTGDTVNERMAVWTSQIPG